MLHTFANKFFLFLCSGASYLTGYQKERINIYFYWNHLDIFLDILKYLRDKYLERQKTDLFLASKDAVDYRVMIAIGRKFKNVKYFTKVFTITYKFLWFIFATNHTGKGQKYQICLSVRIDYGFAPYIKSEGLCTENIRHTMMKVIIIFEHVLNIYMLIW